MERKHEPSEWETAAAKVGGDGIPGEVGFSYEDDPERVQIAQPHSLKPLRTNPLKDGHDFPDPGNIVDAHIGDAARR